MGWSGGSEIFGEVIGPILDSDASEKDKLRIIVSLINALENGDWDCQDECVDNNPLVIDAFLLVHPDWEWLKERRKENLITRCSEFTASLPNSKKSSTVRYNEATNLLADVAEAFKETEN